MRLTAAERALVEQRAATAGITPSGYVAELVRNGRVTIEQRQTLAAPLMVELSRIGNNINQLAHAANAGTPAAAREVLSTMQELFTFLMRDEITRRRVQAFEAEGGHGSEAHAARDEFQGRVGVPVPR